MSESLLTALHSWFTPTILFLFLNLMIVTIAITSSFSSNSNGPNHSQIHRSSSIIHRLKSINFSSFTNNSHLGSATLEDDYFHQPISRSSSVLNRIKSFNLYNYISQEHIEQAPTVNFEAQLEEPDGAVSPKIVQEELEEEEDSSPSLEEVYNSLKLNHMARTKSDTEPASGVIPPKLAKKMKKSASTKSPFLHFQEDEISVEARRPETVKVPRVTTVEEADEVDARADDFISRFKNQLKLQRIDSIAKYKEMVKRKK